MPTRRAEALTLTSELLDDIELHRLSPIDVARKCSRLARLLDDTDAMAWLQFETAGFPPGGLDTAASEAAVRSGRVAPPDDQGQPRFWTASLGQLALEVESGLALINSLTGTASGEWAPTVEASRFNERRALRKSIADSQTILDRVVGALHAYAQMRYQELRFGSAIETAFEVLRGEVDERISGLVPDALPMLNAALENATSDNPEDWASAAATCRRLLKVVADSLRPPGQPVKSKSGRTTDMGDSSYINRLVNWIESRAISDTMAGMIARDLEFLGERLDAADRAGHKGAHGQVKRIEASRYITGTYLLLGDVLRLSETPRREALPGS